MASRLTRLARGALPSRAFSILTSSSLRPSSLPISTPLPSSSSSSSSSSSFPFGALCAAAGTAIGLSPLSSSSSSYCEEAPDKFKNTAMYPPIKAYDEGMLEALNRAILYYIMKSVADVD